MSVSLRQLKAFVAIAHCKSFTKAADELHLTQSSLSGLIKEMEKQIDVKLFERTTRQIHLSEAGERLLPHAVRVLGEMRLLDNEIDSLKDFHQGKVRLAVSQQLAASAIPELIYRFRHAHPNVQVTLLDCPVEKVISSVQLLEADLGIGPDYPFSNDLTASELFSSPFYLVVRPEHPLARRSQIQWQELADAGDLVTLQEPFANQIMSALPTQLNERLFRADYEVNFLSTALGMTKMGLGMTLALPYSKTWVDQHGLVMIPLKDPVIRLKFLLYIHKRRSITPAVAAFRDFLVKQAPLWSPKII
ncbi:MAG: LysR family transcriptional regulator [Moraxella sp.]|nr:LysR family transcriptional regulator [Moraxella sp.]